MSSTSDWEVRAFLCDVDSGEELEYLLLPPGPIMVDWLQTVFEWINGQDPSICSRYGVYLMVTHKPSGLTGKVRILRFNNRFKAAHNNDLISLGAAVRLMKEELNGRE